ncbi:hypothetical protein EG328_004078 [Venturia inaequalis]|uniref:Uncharacterized protein n=1 Tax=Venturia inaequalis TaxID=5025 RepID=A0A8H3UPL8_VENIN|nr:hypothetical protein EG328_004078 [Venturia inaequalis]
MAQFKHDEASTRQHVCEDTEYGLSVIDQLYQDIIFPQRVLYGIPEGAVATEPSDILEERRRQEMGAVTHLNLRLGRLRRFCLWTGWLTTRQLVTSLQSTDPIIRLCIFAQRGVANATSVVAKITPLGTVCSSWRWIPAEVDESRKTHHSNIQGTNIPSPVTTFDPGHVMNNLKAQGLAVPTAREPSPLVGILGTLHTCLPSLILKAARYDAKLEEEHLGKRFRRCCGSDDCKAFLSLDGYERGEEHNITTTVVVESLELMAPVLKKRIGNIDTSVSRNGR